MIVPKVQSIVKKVQNPNNVTTDFSYNNTQVCYKQSDFQATDSGMWNLFYLVF